MPINQIDLHGRSLESALKEVEREINQTFCQEEVCREFRIITGWGGILRPGVKKYLAEHPLVKFVDISGPSILVEVEDK